MKNTFIPAWMRQAALLLVWAALPAAARAQNQSVSILGNTTTCGSASNTFDIVSCFGPLTMTGISSIHDPYTTSPNPFPVGNATYSSTGQLLFSVDQNGIYNADGTPAYDFTVGYTASVTVSGTTTSVTAKQALSEVAVFPCKETGDNTSYYAVFWATTSDAFVPLEKAVLRAVRINMTATGIITGCTDNLLYDATSNGVGVSDNAYEDGCFGIAADGASCGSDRAVYTIEPDDFGTSPVATKLRKWIFPADGTLPNSAVATFQNEQYINAYSPLTKIIRIGTKKYVGFIATASEAIGLGALGSKVILWNISDPYGSGGGDNISGYDISVYGGPSDPNTSPGTAYGFTVAQDLSGTSFVYVSYLSYDYGMTFIKHSGLAFFSLVPTGTGSGTFTRVTGTENCGYTDIQQDGRGDLIMASGNPDGSTGTPAGTLVYLDGTLVGLSSVTLTTPTCAGGGSGHYSVANRTDNISMTFNNLVNAPFYLWKASPQLFRPAYPAFTGIDINTRCAPGYGGSGTPHPQYTVSASGCGSLSYTWAPLDLIETSAGFTISLDPTLDNYTSASPTITGLHPAGFGGLPFLNAGYLLTVKDCSGCTTSMVVRNKLITSGFDLASKDSPFDLYDEANSQTVNPANWNIWASPDIFNRYHANGETNLFAHQTPDYAPPPATTTNYLYVNVRNVGCSDYDPATAPQPAKLHNYWTMGGFSAETWQNSWNGVGQTATLCNGTHQELGSELTSSPVTIPAIVAGSSTALTLVSGTPEVPVTSWTPNDPQLYSPCTIPPPIMELCFLSRIVDGHNSGCTDGMSICENTTGTISANVNNNNNIVTLNTSIARVPSLPIVRPHLVLGGNNGATAAPFSLQFVNDHVLTPGLGSSNLSNYVTIKVSLGDLYGLWTSGGSQGTYSAVNANEKSVTFDGSNTVRLDNIVMPAGSYYPITVEFKLLPGVDGSKMPEEMVHFRQLTQNARIDTLIDSVNVTYVDSTTDTVTHIVTYDTVHTSIYDTTYHSDSVYGNYSFIVQYEPPTKGVLAVTEISNGPSGDCEYAEMVVANCGEDQNPVVDVSGWIIDDNSGNFDTAGCTTSTGIAQGHYRLAYDNTWSNVPVGSVLVMYNHDANCYNMGDTFRVDTTSAGLVYWIPVGGTVASPYGTPHIERFGANPSTSECSYCADSGTTNYTVASAWSNTIGLNNTEDAFQVRCPGCTTASPGSPAFYHGIGYGPATGVHAYASIPAGTGNLGGPVKTGSGTGKKFVFTGVSVADLGDPAQWTASTADAAGTTPTSLGVVNTTFMNNVNTHALNLPCCGSGGGTSRHTHVADEHAVIPATDQHYTLIPNPNNGDLSITQELVKDGTARIRIMNIAGSLVYDNDAVFAGGKTSISLYNAANGVYIVELVDSDGQRFTSKMVVEK